MNKLRFIKFLKKAETEQKYEETDLKIWGNWPFNYKYWEKYTKKVLKVFEKAETDQKYEETDQQIEIYKVFEKSGNWSEVKGNRPKMWGNRSKKKR